MGILVSVIVGITLIADQPGGDLRAPRPCWSGRWRATAGCCAQMVGFAVMTYKENGPGGDRSGLGIDVTSAKYHEESAIWIPPTLTAAITGQLQH